MLQTVNDKHFENEVLKSLKAIDMSDKEFDKLDTTLAKLEEIAYKKIYSKIKLKEVIQEELKLSNYKNIKEHVKILEQQLLASIDSRNNTLKIITQYRNKLYKARMTQKNTRSLFKK